MSYVQVEDWLDTLYNWGGPSGSLLAEIYSYMEVEEFEDDAKSTRKNAAKVLHRINVARLPSVALVAFLTITDMEIYTYPRFYDRVRVELEKRHGKEEMARLLLPFRPPNKPSSYPPKMSSIPPPSKPPRK